MKVTIEFPNRISRYPSTLLIPAEAMKQFRAMEKRFGSLRNFLNKAVLAKHWAYALHPRLHEPKILYQEKGQNLKKIGFRPFDEDWERFRLLAVKQRVSMTRLFVLLLLYWDTDSGGVPTIPLKSIVKQSLVASAPFTYIEIQRIII